MAVQIQLRRGPASDWTTYNPILAEGEPGIETDTGNLKIGNGTASWSQLEYSNLSPTDYLLVSASSNFDLAGSASAAEFNAKAYADSLATNYDSAGSASAAQNAAQSYADSLAVNYDVVGSASAAEFNANAYTASAIASLVDSAPSTLDTLNELAAALGDDANFATSTASAIGDRLTIAAASATYLTKSDAQSTYLPISGSVNWSNINNKPDPSITLTGDVSGSTTLTDLNSASIAVTVEKDFSLTFTGDVTGSGTVNNLASASISLTVAANSIALGTDTTGNYVAGLTAGNGISITGTAGEGWSPTVSINSSTASVAFANITSKPTTLNGYGITDALSVSSSSNFLAVSASSNFAPLTILRNEQTGTSYTLVIGDAGKLIEMNNASPNTLIVPLDASVSFPVGTKIDILQTGAGQTTASAVSGVTINSKEGNAKLTGQWSAATLVKRATDTWVLIGDLSA